MFKILLASAGLLAFTQAAQADQVYFNDFDNSAIVANEVIAEYNPGAGATVVSNTDWFDTYGNFFRSDSSTVMSTLTLSNLVPHSQVALSFTMIFLDSWDSNDSTWGPDNLDFYVDGQLFASYTYNNSTGTLTQIGGGSLVLQYGQFDTNEYYTDTVVDMSGAPELTFAHTGSTLTLAMVASGAGWQGSNDEAWGIDNLRVDITPVPEPSTYAMMLAGLGLVGAVARSRRRSSNPQR